MQESRFIKSFSLSIYFYGADLPVFPGHGVSHSDLHPESNSGAETREEPIFRHVRPSEKQMAKPTLQDFNAGKSTVASQHVLVCHK